MSEVSTSSINQAGPSTEGASDLLHQQQHDFDPSRASQLALLDELAAADDADVDSLHDNSDPSAAFKISRQNLVRLPSGKGGKDKYGDADTASVGLFVCAGCGTHLALQDEVISKAFSGRDGKVGTNGAWLSACAAYRVLTKLHPHAHLDLMLLASPHSFAGLPLPLLHQHPNRQARGQATPHGPAHGSRRAMRWVREACRVDIPQGLGGGAEV